jgi:hypothetical protein
MQERILLAVNSHRESMDIPAIPSTTKEYADLLTADPDDLEWEATAIADATKAEDERLGTIMREFDAIVEEQRSTLHDAQASDILRATRDSAPRTPIQQDGIEVLEYDKLPWDVVADRAPTNPLVLEALGTQDTALKEAICIVFYQMRGAPQNWPAPVTIRQVREVAEWIRNERGGA